MATLTDLFLRCNRCGDDGVKVFASILKDDPGVSRIENLFLEENNFTGEAAQTIFEAVQHHKCMLRHLSLSRNNLQKDNAFSAFQALATSLILPRCPLVHLLKKKFPKKIFGY